MRSLYTIFFYLATPFILLRLLWLSRKLPAYRHRIKERFGYIKPLPKASMWLHAVSLGETIAALPLIKVLLEKYPEQKLVITTSTPSGSEAILRHFKEHKQVVHVYVPYDLPTTVSRFFMRINPVVGIIMETELWPNLLFEAANRHLPILLVNARLSARSCKAYQYIPRMTRAMLERLSLVVGQSQADGDRFIQIGLKPNHLRVAGNIKFDIHIPDSVRSKGKALRNSWKGRLTFIAASTHEGEETVVLKAFSQIRVSHPDALLLLVPRHPERFDKVAKLCSDIDYSVARRSLKQLPDTNTAIYLGDTLGELRLLYATSDVAFLGGSLSPIGGHNFIEPAAFNLPIITGPELHNCTSIRDLLQAANALTIIHNDTELAHMVSKFFDDKNLRKKMGQRARDVSEANKGALVRHIQCIQEVMQKSRNRGRNLREHLERHF